MLSTLAFLFAPPPPQTLTLKVLVMVMAWALSPPWTLSWRPCWATQQHHSRGQQQQGGGAVCTQTLPSLTANTGEGGGLGGDTACIHYDHASKRACTQVERQKQARGEGLSRNVDWPPGGRCSGRELLLRHLAANEA